jgi:hypothetical protein
MTGTHVELRYVGAISENLSNVRFGFVNNLHALITIDGINGPKAV